MPALRASKKPRSDNVTYFCDTSHINIVTNLWWSFHFEPLKMVIDLIVPFFWRIHLKTSTLFAKTIIWIQSNIRTGNAARSTVSTTRVTSVQLLKQAWKCWSTLGSGNFVVAKVLAFFTQLVKVRRGKIRVEICGDRRDRRSCKILVSCVNFSRKQHSFLHSFVSLHTPNANFLHNCWRIYTFCSILTKKDQITDNDAFTLFYCWQK